MRRTVRHASAGAAALILLAALAACSDDGESGGDRDGEPWAMCASTRVAEVYYLVDTRTGLRLVREPHFVSEAAAAEDAVRAMIEGPDDPDYTSTWNPATEVLGIRLDGAVATVDLSGDARTANVGSPGAALMIQQLVHTVTDVLGEDLAVVLEIDGSPAGELWGAVSWDGPVDRDRAVDVRQLVQIDWPREGARVPSPLRVTGDAAVFEANLPWRVLDADGAEVASGSTSTAAGQRFAGYGFEVDLAPGSYTVEITEDDPSGGEAGPLMTDSRRVTVDRAAPPAGSTRDCASAMLGAWMRSRHP